MEIQLLKYLKILNQKRDIPSGKYLQNLVAAQLEFFPYENISKLFYFSQGLKYIPTLDQYLSDNEIFCFGSTCYAQNLYFNELLNFLGFESSIVLCNVDGKGKDHISCKVKFNSEIVIVDFGFMNSFSGPFNLLGPIVNQTISGRTFLFIPLSNETFRIEIYKEGMLQRYFDSAESNCLSKDLEDSIQNSFNPDAHFMKSLVISKRWGNPTYTIYNSEFIIGDGEKMIKSKISSSNELKKIVADNMNLPSYPIQLALEVLKEKDQLFF